jgi:hypothetical protein
LWLLFVLGFLAQYLYFIIYIYIEILNMGDSQDEWFTICDEKNIVLKKNDENMYKIIFSINVKNNEDTVLNVLKNGQLFELLSALNPDVIEKVDENERDGIYDIFISFKNSTTNSNHVDELDKVVNAFFSIKYLFSKNKCVIESQNCGNDIENQNAKMKNGKEFIHVSKIKLVTIEMSNKTSMCLTFKVDKKVSNIINMYIGLYFKKIFHRFKQYFE